VNSDKFTYCFDANILIAFYHAYPFSLCPDLWQNLDELFNAGRIFSHHIVFQEICHDKKKPDDLAKWLAPKERWFFPITQRQVQVLPEILKIFPRLIDSNREKEQADPWLIALLIEKTESIGLFPGRSDYIFICNENKNSTIRLPAACRHYDIVCKSGLEFFQLNNWTLSIKSQ